MPPIVRDGRRFRFVVPGTDAPVFLMTRATVPSRARPWIDDQRLLGVAVHRLTVHEAGSTRTIALDDPALDVGWWAPEGDGATAWRWTSGRASLPCLSGPGVLEVEIGETLPYPMHDEVRVATTAIEQARRRA
jgi:hypothetical protein